MIEASATRSPSMPCTRSSAIDHRHRVAAHLAGAGRMVDRAAAAAGRNPAAPRRVCTAGPGWNSGLDESLHVRVAPTSAGISLRPATIVLLVGLGRPDNSDRPPARRTGQRSSI